MKTFQTSPMIHQLRIPPRIMTIISIFRKQSCKRMNIEHVLMCRRHRTGQRAANLHWQSILQNYLPVQDSDPGFVSAFNAIRKIKKNIIFVKNLGQIRLSRIRSGRAHQLQVLLQTSKTTLWCGGDDDTWNMCACFLWLIKCLSGLGVW